MTVRSATAHPSLDWQRVAALSSSFGLHVAAAALIAIPLAMPLRLELPKIAEATLYEIKPPPEALPLPPDPAPPLHVKPEHRAPAVAVKPLTPTATPVPDAPPSEVPAATEPAAAGPATDIGAGTTTGGGSGVSRTLAYAGALQLRYPPMSIRQHEQGTVLLRVLVDAEGAAQRIEIERSSGHPKLDAAAREAVQHAHFRPVLQNGQAVPAWGLVPIEFRLDRV